ncbi:MAG TPA: glycosyltransferase [Hanamia sp.]|nr:glycosyltransferase [Hanamia sp.]
MERNPLVSILLLSMNHESYIEQCIQSIINQTYKNIEIIYLDNASRDNTFKVGKKFLEESGITFKMFLNREPKSISQNLNFLLEYSSGQYISPLSTDDWFAPKNIEKKVNFYLNNPDTGALFSNGWYYYEKEKKTILNNSTTFKRGRLFKEILMHPDCMFYVGVIYNRDIIEKIGKWDENLIIEDLDMYIRIGLIATIDFIDEPLVYYRRSSESASRSSRFMLDGFKQYYEKYKGESWINMKKWLAERYRLFAADCIDDRKRKEAAGLILNAIKLNPLSLNNFRTIFYLIRQSL